MSDQGSYWTQRMLSRRAALRGAFVAGGSLAALSLVGCGGGDDDDGGESGAATTQEILDPAKGVRGGKLIWQSYGEPGGGLELFKIRNAGVHQIGGPILEGLLEHRNGTPAFDGYDIQPQPNLAQAMPEQPADGLTYIYKLRPAKFHNGRTVTSEDVKYTLERYAYGEGSAMKSDYVYLDKVETPDPTTAVIKTKFAFADALMAHAGNRAYDGIQAKEHQEGPDAGKRLIGTGPYLFVEHNPPVIARYKRNPEYHRQPYPYFDEIDRLGDSDVEKKVADFIAKSVHYTYWFNPELRDRIKKARPDANVWQYLSGGGAVYFRTDQKPFNDKRVRQALSMAIDRKQYAAGVSQGEGIPDQVLSIAGKFWGFREPKDLGAAAKYWIYDPQAAKQLMSAAGVTPPLEGYDFPHWNAQVVGQGHVDAATIIQAHWRNAGVANTKDVELTFGQASGTLTIGNYNGMQYQPNTVAYNPIMGLTLKNELWSPPEGVKGPPTLNRGYVNNQTLSALLDKQIGQRVKEERVATLRQIEDILAEEQYRLALATSSNSWFGDPHVKNMQAPRDAYNFPVAGSFKYWWFDGGKAP